jgi:predicted dehydrogenase
VHDPEQGGGRIIGEVCHFVDLLAFLAGDQVMEVQAAALPDGGRYRQDNVAVTLRFARGSVGTIVYGANGDRALEKERIEVMTAGRSAVLDDYRTLTCYEQGRRRRSTMGVDKGHRAELRAFVQSVERGEPSPVSFRDAVHATEVTLAIVAALSTGTGVLLSELA